MPFINIFDTGGINQSLPHTKINRNECTQLDNFIHSYTPTNAGELISFMQKAPSEQTYLDDLGSVSGLGLYQFKSYDGQTLYTAGVFTDGKIYTAGSASWDTTIASGLSTTSSVDFAHYYRKETKDTVCVMTNGSDAMMKWHTEDAATGYLYNKGGEGNQNLTGTLTFTKDSKAVSGSGTDFDPEIQVGDYIRVGDYEMFEKKEFPDSQLEYSLFTEIIQREAKWYRVETRTSDTALTLETAFSGETIVGGSGKSQIKAAPLKGTITFTNASDAITGVASSFSTELTVGQHIRKNATGRWYEIESVTTGSSAVLRATFKEATGAGLAKGSQGSLPMNRWGYIKLFEAKGIQKMIYGYDVTGSNYGLWRHATPGDPENVPTKNNDRIPGMMTGIFQIGNYLGFFTETNYYIYKYVATDDDFKRIGTGVQGCSASATIQEMPGGVIFLSNAGLFKLSIQEGLENVGKKVQIELSLASVAGADLPERYRMFG